MNHLSDAYELLQQTNHLLTHYIQDKRFNPDNFASEKLSDDFNKTIIRD